MDRISVILYISYLIYLALAFVFIFQIIRVQLTFSLPKSIEKIFMPKSTRQVLRPERGSIYACDGRLLAMSMPLYDIYMDCTVKKEAFANKPSEEKAWQDGARGLAEGLARIIGAKTASGYYSAIMTGRRGGNQYLKLVEKIGHETLQQLKALPLFSASRYYSGIIVEHTDTRQYPYGALARRTIGYVKDNAKSNGNNMIGLEGRFDSKLHGTEGYRWMKKADNGARIPDADSSSRKPENGCDLRTTIDIDIQDIADKALRGKIGENPGVEGGCCVIMDVETGAIRAMVNLLRDSVSGRMGENYNLAVGRIGEPGSVFKSTTLMTLLEDGKVKIHDEIPTDHGDVKGFSRDQHIADYERINHTDKISILHGFEISSNYVFRRLAIDHYGDKPKKLIDRLHTYKLDEAYEFDLDGFSKPSLPSPESKWWSKTDLGSVAIGYAVGETPLHIVTFYNAIANRGRMMKPYLVESVERGGSVKEKYGPSVLNSSICSHRTADTLIMALSRVTEEGTGKNAFRGALCHAAGKTGTARTVLDARDKPRKGNAYMDASGRMKFQATFVGFFPAEQPKYTAIVVLYSKLSHQTFYGGTLPAGAFREIMDKVYAMDPDNGEVLKKKGSVPKWT